MSERRSRRQFASQRSPGWLRFVLKPAPTPLRHLGYVAYYAATQRGIDRGFARALGAAHERLAARAEVPPAPRRFPAAVQVRKGAILEAWSQLDRAHWGRFIAVEGLETLRDAAAPGRGVILIALHLGPHFLAPALASEVRPASIVAHPAVFDELEEVRRGNPSIAALPLRFLDATRPATVASLVRALRRGELVCIYGDAAFGATDWIAADFLGRRSKLPTTVARLRELTGAALVAGRIDDADPRLFAARTKVRYERLDPGGGSVAAQTRAMASYAERCILAKPASWSLWPVLEAGVFDAPPENTER